MDDSDVCPTEDAVQAFVEYLIEPVLPAKSSLQGTPSLTQQQLVAKQVHALVLLYNYYLRKRHPQLEVLGFEPFCKLLVILKPTLLAHMKLMQSSDDTELDDLDKQLSVTEKVIMEACDVSASLDASKDVPDIERWPISKVAVLLSDFKKEKCFLLFSSITQGVWSVIERDVDTSKLTSEGTEVAKEVNKKTRIVRKRPKDESSVNESGLLQLAHLAVKEATGINETDLLVLESHAVYSLSKEKTAVRFYIMQCAKSVKEDVVQIPIKDAIESLQGPLIQKISNRWMTTPVVEYYHVLPYAGIVSTWLSREVLSGSSEDLRLGEGNSNLSSADRTLKPCTLEIHRSQNSSSSMNFNSADTTEKPCSPEIRQSQDSSHIDDGLLGVLGKISKRSITESLKQKNKNGCGLAASLKVPQKMDWNETSIVPTQNGEKGKKIANTIQVDDHEEKMRNSMESKLNVSPSSISVKDEMVDSVRRPHTTECSGKQNATGSKTCDNILPVQDVIGDHALVAYQFNQTNLDKLQNTIASKQNELSCSALRVLLRKRDELSLQQRNIEDEIAECDKKIQKILNGSEDDLALKIESVIEGCNGACLRRITEERAHQQLEDQRSPQNFKRKRLSEAVLRMQNPCQELDCVCYENNWILPTYHVSASDDGFKAGVTVKGMDFECSSDGEVRPNPRGARESAAAQMVANLRRMASSTS